MSKKTVDLGSGYDTGDGDKLRDGGSKINDNFDELYKIAVSWFAQTYDVRTSVIVGDVLYILASGVVLPFVSTDFNAEFANGDWIVASGGSGGSTTDDIENKSTIGGASATNALDNAITVVAPYVQGPTYRKNTLVSVDDWIRISNQATSEYAGLTLIGTEVDFVLKDIVFSQLNNLSVVKCVQKYTITSEGLINNIFIKVPFFDANSYVRLTLINLTKDTIATEGNFLATTNEWVIVKQAPKLLTIGDEIEFWLEYYNSTGAAAVNGFWTSDENTGAPNNGDFRIDSVNNPTVVEIHHTDMNGTDHQATLDGIGVNSIIDIFESGSSDRTFKATISVIDTADANSTKYTLINVANGPRDIRDGRDCTINIENALTVPSEYFIAVDNLLGNQPTWATVISRLEFDGVVQAGTNDAFGISVGYQEISLSSQWDTIYTPFTGGSSGGTDTPPVAASNLYILIDDANVYKGANLDQNNIEAGDIIVRYPASNRYIHARVNSLPYTDDANLSFFEDITII